MIDKVTLIKLYEIQGLSMKQIAEKLNCSVHKVQYWINKHSIKTRSISEAVYKRNNPRGDPFIFKQPNTKSEAFLYGLGLGLYWGEGTKKNKYSVRLGNTDPQMIESFLKFLVRFFSIKKEDCKFGLQIFSDCEPTRAKNFWKKKLGISEKQLYKVTVTKSGSIGSYKNRNQNGVLTIYYNNSKLKCLLDEKLAALASSSALRASEDKQW